MYILVPQDDVLEALQFQLLAISQKDQRKRTDVKSGKEEFFTDAHELKKRFDERNQKIDALWEPKIRILGHVGDRVAQSGLEINKPCGVGVQEREGDGRVRSVSLFERTDGCSDGGEAGFFRCLRSLHFCMSERSELRQGAF